MCVPLATFFSLCKDRYCERVFLPSFPNYPFWLPPFLQQLSSPSTSYVIFCKEKETCEDVKLSHLLGCLWTSGEGSMRAISSWDNPTKQNYQFTILWLVAGQSLQAQNSPILPLPFFVPWVPVVTCDTAAGPGISPESCWACRAPWPGHGRRRGGPQYLFSANWMGTDFSLCRAGSVQA